MKVTIELIFFMMSRRFHAKIKYIFNHIEQKHQSVAGTNAKLDLQDEFTALKVRQAVGY